MVGLLDQLKEKILTCADQNREDGGKTADINDKIALGVLLWTVAESDEKFLPEEEEKIKEILTCYSGIATEEVPLVLNSIKQAAIEKIDLYRFTSEVKKDLSYKAKIGILENLFRVACADKDLDHNEIEIIRKIAGLLGVEHKEFIDSKIKIKKESGI